MRTIQFILIIILLLNPFQGVSQNASGQYLSPSMRAGEYLGAVDLPNFTIELGALDFGVNLNFNAGEILKGDQTANLKNLSQNRDYLIIHNNFSSIHRHRHPNLSSYRLFSSLKIIFVRKSL